MGKTWLITSSVTFGSLNCLGFGTVGIGACKRNRPQIDQCIRRSRYEEGNKIDILCSLAGCKVSGTSVRWSHAGGGCLRYADVVGNDGRDFAGLVGDFGGGGNGGDNRALGVVLVRKTRSRIKKVKEDTEDGHVRGCIDIRIQVRCLRAVLYGILKLAY